MKLVTKSDRGADLATSDPDEVNLCWKRLGPHGLLDTLTRLAPPPLHVQVHLLYCPFHASISPTL